VLNSNTQIAIFHQLTDQLRRAFIQSDLKLLNQDLLKTIKLEMVVAGYQKKYYIVDNFFFITEKPT
jgi:hypothetical protein